MRLASTPRSLALFCRKKRARVGMSSRRSRSAGRRRRITFRRWNRSSRKPPRRTRSSRFWWVAAITRTLLLSGWWPPTRENCPSQRPRNQLLAGAGLASDQHRDVALAEPTDGAENVLHGRRLTQHLGHLRDAVVEHLFAHAFFDRAADELDRLGQIEGLGQVFEGATLEGRDGAVQVGVGGHDDDRQTRMAGLDLAQQVDARAARHADV